MFKKKYWNKIFYDSKEVHLYSYVKSNVCGLYCSTTAVTRCPLVAEWTALDPPILTGLIKALINNIYSGPIWANLTNYLQGRECVGQHQQQVPCLLFVGVLLVKCWWHLSDNPVPTETDKFKIIDILSLSLCHNFQWKINIFGNAGENKKRTNMKYVTIKKNWAH